MVNSRRYKSIQPSFNNNEEDRPVPSSSLTVEEETLGEVNEVVNFPSSTQTQEDQQLEQQQLERPVLLNSKQHVVGYLNRILNARVYEAAIETQLQHAKSLSTVRLIRSFLCNDIVERKI